MINVTPKASERIKHLLKEKGDAAYFVRISVKGGGCSGFTYAVNLDNQTQSTDRSFGDSEARIVSDVKSLLYLSGIEIDYSDDLTNGGFRFKNPNAAGSCGCGTSFSV